MILAKAIFSLALVGSTLAFAPRQFGVARIMTSVPPSKTAVAGEYGASSTSFYTDAEKKDSYESLEDILSTKCADEQVRQVIVDMLDVCAEITEALRAALVVVEGSTNDFGDKQLSVDVSYARFLNMTACVYLFEDVWIIYGCQNYSDVLSLMCASRLLYLSR
jgi:hypothetical protein